jgi:hypothetical protein
METSMVDVNVDKTPVAIGSVDQDDEILQLARDELLGYLYVFQNSPPDTLTNTREMSIFFLIEKLSHLY